MKRHLILVSAGPGNQFLTPDSPVIGFEKSLMYHLGKAFRGARISNDLSIVHGEGAAAIVASELVSQLGVSDRRLISVEACSAGFNSCVQGARKSGGLDCILKTCPSEHGSLVVVDVADKVRKWAGVLRLPFATITSSFAGRAVGISFDADTWVAATQKGQVFEPALNLGSWKNF